jgi:hypothetical protein
MECVFSFFFFMLLEQEAHKQDDRQSFERFIVGVLTRNTVVTALAPLTATASVVGLLSVNFKDKTRKHANLVVNRKIVHGGNQCGIPPAATTDSYRRPPSSLVVTNKLLRVTQARRWNSATKEPVHAIDNGNISTSVRAHVSIALKCLMRKQVTPEAPCTCWFGPERDKVRGETTHPCLERALVGKLRSRCVAAVSGLGTQFYNNPYKSIATVVSVGSSVNVARCVVHSPHHPPLDHHQAHSCFRYIIHHSPQCRRRTVSHPLSVVPTFSRVSSCVRHNHNEG